MSDWNQPWVLDHEAYQERLAIMLESLGSESSPPPADQISLAASEAAECAYRTPFSIVATKAARGDWEPAKELCRGERDRHGDRHARELMRAIQEAVRAKLESIQER